MSNGVQFILALFASHVLIIIVFQRQLVKIGKLFWTLLNPHSAKHATRGDPQQCSKCKQQHVGWQRRRQALAHCQCIDPIMYTVGNVSHLSHFGGLCFHEKTPFLLRFYTAILHIIIRCKLSIFPIQNCINHWAEN